jgi:hypothetical membrane protein
MAGVLLFSIGLYPEKNPIHRIIGVGGFEMKL